MFRSNWINFRGTEEWRRASYYSLLTVVRGVSSILLLRPTVKEANSCLTILFPPKNIVIPIIHTHSSSYKRVSEFKQFFFYIFLRVISHTGGDRLKITPQMICAGVKGTILSGCHGDSGGPYVCQASNGRWVLQGAVSWGSPRCSAAERYTVFARVAKFRNWISQYVRI